MNLGIGVRLFDIGRDRKNDAPDALGRCGHRRAQHAPAGRCSSTGGYRDSSDRLFHGSHPKDVHGVGDVTRFAEALDQLIPGSGEQALRLGFIGKSIQCQTVL